MGKSSKTTPKTSPAASRLAEAAAILGGLIKPRNAKSASELMKAYFAHVATDDVMTMAPTAIAELVASHWQFAARRGKGQDVVRVFTPPAIGTTRTVVEVVTDDKPFLVSSVTSEIMRRGHRIHIVLHPILNLRRDPKGRLLGLNSDAAASGALVESFMHFELDGVLDAGEQTELAARVAKVLADVGAAVGDWRSMVGRLQETIDEIDTTPPPLDAAEIAEAKAFMRWLADNHFTLLGCRDYEYRRTGSKEALIPRDKSGLGLMRDPGFRMLNVAGMANDLPPMIRDFLKLPRLLIITKANVRSTVHRPIYMDYIGVKRFDMAGRVIGERRFVGLFTSEAYNRSPREVPLLRRKIALMLERAGLGPQSHDGKALVNILETYPRDELFQISDEELHQIAMGILQLQERPRVRLFVRQDKFERFVSALVFVPREAYGTELRTRIEKILARAWSGRNSAFYVQMGDGALTRLHFIVGTTPGNVPRPDVKALEVEITEATRTWDDGLSSAMVEVMGPMAGSSRARRYAGAFPASYRETTSPSAAIRDIALLETLKTPGDEAVDLMALPGLPPHEVHFKVHHCGEAIPLSDVLPMFENLGLRVIEEMPHHIVLDGQPISVQDFHLSERRGQAVGIDAIKSNFEAAFLAVRRGEAENDTLNMLVLRAGLTWRQVVVLRTLTKYLRQAGITFSNSYMEAVLTNNPAIARLLVDLFEARFDPARPRKAAEADARKIAAKIGTSLDAVTNADEDRILRRFLNLIEAALRTNYFQPGADGRPKPYISVKFASSKVAELPLPRPMFEVFVYSVRAEAIHLRGGKVARGGIRWSDRREDFRTEILGLMKAQMVKNAVIVPVGAKGGFVCKRLPQGAPPDVVQKEVIECYRTLIRGLLDITDNMKGLKVAPPPHVVRHDADDPYLVVAADKGTATFSDIANALSIDYGFWLDDAFASGGSAGYDHKKMGITAKGAWVAVERHFRELGIDANKANITVAGIGDMSGDVFGNGMLLSPNIKLVAAFNHAHIFLDPVPDPARSFAERKRLFNLPRSSWTDYSAKAISKGGGVLDRKAKLLKLSPEARQLIGIDRETIAPNDLVRAILAMPVDLLWNGGIGTYVKASTETNAQVGDRANDVLRIDGRDVRARVIGEGGNLGLTQRGRVEYALNGGRINTDAIDNSAGVDCSDHEVNIKVLLGGVAADGKLKGPARNKLLARMTDEVGQLVLQDNYLQTQAISIAEAQTRELAEVQVRFMRRLERAARLDRAVEYLPDDETVTDRLRSGKGLARPEIAVLLAYAKMTLYEDLLETNVPDDPYLSTDLYRYFPRELRKSYGKWVERHRLRREIIATFAVNSMVNRVGPTFVEQIAEEGGFSPDEIFRAYAITRDIFGLRRLFTEIEALDLKVSASVQTEAMIAIGALVRHATLWLLRNARRPISISAEINRLQPGIGKIGAALGHVLTGTEAQSLKDRVAKLTRAGMPETLARQVAGLAPMNAALDIVTASLDAKRSVEDVARAYFAVGEKLGLDWLRSAAGQLNPQTHWERQAIAAIVDDLYGSQRVLAGNVLKEGRSIKDALDAWTRRQSATLDRAAGLVAEFRAGVDIDVAKLAIANRQIRALVA